jgi:hypothetical protein
VLMEKEIKNEKCSHEWGAHPYGHQCKICRRIMYGSWANTPRSIYKTQILTEGMVNYTEGDVFNLEEEK